MVFLLVLFGILFGCFSPILIGILGSKRNIGFTWAFILSLILTPIIGLIITLISDPKPEGSERNYGCLGSFFMVIVFIIIFLLVIGALLSIPLSLINNAQ